MSILAATTAAAITCRAPTGRRTSRAARAWRRTRVLVALAGATTFATLASVCMGLAMVGRSSARMAGAGAANLVPNLLVGTGEAMGGGLLGFATLTLVAILAAIGLARGQTAPE